MVWSIEPGMELACAAGDVELRGSRRSRIASRTMALEDRSRIDERRATGTKHPLKLSYFHAADRRRSSWTRRQKQNLLDFTEKIVDKQPVRAYLIKCDMIFL